MSNKVSISSEKGSLKLRFTYKSKRYTFTDRFADTRADLKRAKLVAGQIELDLVSGNFIGLEKYKNFATERGVTNPSIQRLWESYMLNREKTVKASTMLKQFAPMTNYLDSIKTYKLSEAEGLIKRIIKDKPRNAAKRLLVQLNACCDWHISNKKIDSNPFRDVTKRSELKKQKAESKPDIKPFSKDERARILSYFLGESNYLHYYHLIRFLMLTGCRPSEAVALTWDKVTEVYVTFDCAIISGHESEGLQQGTKTQDSREFPINSELKTLLEVTPRYDSNLLFPGKDGESFIRLNNLSQRVWKPALEAVGVPYRKLYQLRHTFITECLNAGIDAKDIAYWVGNSPEIIYRHYAGVDRDLLPPSF